jgi:hypothetical protein
MSTPAWRTATPQAAEVTESIRGRLWADVADKVDAEEAALVELAAHCSPPGVATFGDFLASTRCWPGRRWAPPRLDGAHAGDHLDSHGHWNKHNSLGLKQQNQSGNKI